MQQCCVQCDRAWRGIEKLAARVPLPRRIERAAGVPQRGSV
jgi:hypothetical protein